MKSLMAFSLFLFGCASTSKYELPKLWDKDFSISYFHGSGMAYESTNINLSKDSCVYTEMESGKDDVKKFMLTDSEFDQVLKKMQDLELVKIRSKEEKLVHDMPTTKICFSKKGKDDYCVETGATIKLHNDDYEKFNVACKYLLDLVKSKTK